MWTHTPRSLFARRWCPLSRPCPPLAEETVTTDARRHRRPASGRPCGDSGVSPASGRGGRDTGADAGALGRSSALRRPGFCAQWLRREEVHPADVCAGPGKAVGGTNASVTTHPDEQNGQRTGA